MEDKSKDRVPSPSSSSSDDSTDSDDSTSTDSDSDSRDRASSSKKRRHHHRRRRKSRHTSSRDSSRKRRHHSKHRSRESRSHSNADKLYPDDPADSPSSRHHDDDDRHQSNSAYNGKFSRFKNQDEPYKANEASRRYFQGRTARLTNYHDKLAEIRNRNILIRNWQDMTRQKIMRDKQKNLAAYEQIQIERKQLEDDKWAFQQEIQKMETEAERRRETLKKEEKKHQETLTHCQWWDSRLKEREAKLLQNCVKYEQSMTHLNERAKKNEAEEERLKNKHRMLIQDEIRLQKEKEILLDFVRKCSSLTAVSNSVQVVKPREIVTPTKELVQSSRMVAQPREMVTPTPELVQVVKPREMMTSTPELVQSSRLVTQPLGIIIPPTGIVAQTNSEILTQPPATVTQTPDIRTPTPPPPGIRIRFPEMPSRPPEIVTLPHTEVVTPSIVPIVPTFMGGTPLQGVASDEDVEKLIEYVPVEIPDPSTTPVLDERSENYESPGEEIDIDDIFSQFNENPDEVVIKVEKDLDIPILDKPMDEVRTDEKEITDESEVNTDDTTEPEIFVEPYEEIKMNVEEILLDEEDEVRINVPIVEEVKESLDVVPNEIRSEDVETDGVLISIEKVVEEEVKQTDVAVEEVKQNFVPIEEVKQNVVAVEELKQNVVPTEVKQSIVPIQTEMPIEMQKSAAQIPLQKPVEEIESNMIVYEKPVTTTMTIVNPELMTRELMMPSGQQQLQIIQATLTKTSVLIPEGELVLNGSDGQCLVTDNASARALVSNENEAMCLETWTPSLNKADEEERKLKQQEMADETYWKTQKMFYEEQIFVNKMWEMADDMEAQSSRAKEKWKGHPKNGENSEVQSYFSRLSDQDVPKYSSWSTTSYSRYEQPLNYDSGSSGGSMRQQYRQQQQYSRQSWGNNYNNNNWGLPF